MTSLWASNTRAEPCRLLVRRREGSCYFSVLVLHPQPAIPFSRPFPAVPYAGKRALIRITSAGVVFECGSA